MEKRKLAEIALTALVLASSSSVLATDAINSTTNAGTFLAAGCAGGHCNSKISDNSTNSNPYNARTNRYQASSCSAGKNSPNYTQSSCSSSKPSYAQSSCSSSKPAYTQSSCSNTQRNASTASTYDANGSSFNTNRGYNTAPNANDTYRTYSSDSEVQANTNMNRNYNTAGDYDYQRTGTGQSSMSPTTMNEADLAKQLNAQGRAIWNSLDPEGKALALQLASQESYRDKNLAVKEAQRRINERRGMTQSNDYNR